MSNEIDYKETIQLPDTDFSMRANLTELEPRIQEKWEEIALYDQMRQNREGDDKFVLHDGPPYANGDVHIGTALNKILKDVVVRYHSIAGDDTPYVPGWDCHGLPIEWKVLQELGDEAEELEPSEIRKRCEDSASHWLDVQRDQFRRLGCVGDWEHPYITMEPSYEEAVIGVFQDLLESGHVYRRNKTIHWCIDCKTALAGAELEYKEKTSNSIFVKFPLQNGFLDAFGVNGEDDAPGYVIIWTTTPWTLPANMATAVHPDLEYCLIRTHDPLEDQPAYYMFAAELVDRMSDVLNLGEPEVVGKMSGKDLEDLQYDHPFLDRECPIILADYVDLDEGTGCVHTAPGHGEEDYYTGLEYDIDPICPVDEGGTFTDGAGPYAGINVYKSEDDICNDLKEDGYLLDRRDFHHEYPHCWRCKNPVIFRATPQWFVDVEHEDVRNRAIETTREVNWVPDWGQTRMEAMLKERPDWCISRQRNWGVPIPVLYCKECGEPLLDPEIVEETKDIFGEEGANVWFEEPGEYFLPGDFTCDECGAGEFQKETDIFDVWFESGSSHSAVVENNPDLEFPADLYLEGTDQHRGWFQVSLLPSVIRHGHAPYREVVTHGFVVNQEGDKISKSDMKGLSLQADTLREEFGADILRLWVTSVDFTDDIPISREILQEKSEPYKKIRRTMRYLHGNLHDFDPEENSVEFHDLEELDLWVLHELSELIDEVQEHYENYRFHRVIREIHNFCTVQMSNFYLDVSKDRLYCSRTDSNERRSAQTASWTVLTSLVKILSPVLVHTADELWEHLPGTEADSVHLADWPTPPERWKNDDLGWRWERLLEIREALYEEIEGLREDDKINESGEVNVELFSGNQEFADLLDDYVEKLPSYFLVSEVSIRNGSIPEDVTTSDELAGIGFRVTPSDNEKCDRCWRYLPSVGNHEDFEDLCDRCHDIVSEHISE